MCVILGNPYSPAGLAAGSAGEELVEKFHKQREI
jgi:hypothetical protein